jgi:hypothetical protein
MSATPPSGDGPRPTETGHVRCPHCHSPIPVPADHTAEVVCPGCGGSFRLQDAPLTSTTAEVRSLGRFQLLGQVGMGAFGAVWRARDPQLDRLVALKLLHPGLVSSAADRERFQREARAAAQLRHPGIVTVHEVTTLDGVPAIVSDFIDGVSLREFLEARRLTFRESAELVAQVAEALDYAHGMGLVHRDIKPANVMIDIDRSRGGGAGLDGAAAGFGAGLRPGVTGGGRGDYDGGRPDPGHAGLHEPGAGAGPRPPGGPPQRRVRAGGGAVRAAVRRAAVPRQQGDAATAGFAGGAAAAPAAQRQDPARPGDRLPQGHGQGPEPALCHRPGPVGRPAAIPGGGADTGPASGKCGAGVALVSARTAAASPAPRRTPR